MTVEQIIAILKVNTGMFDRVVEELGKIQAYNLENEKRSTPAVEEVQKNETLPLVEFLPLTFQINGKVILSADPLNKKMVFDAEQLTVQIS